MPSGIIAVTGPVASGKSTFCRILSSLLSAPWIDFDTLAKELYTNEEVKRFVKREIESNAYNLEGKFMPQVLFRSIFSDVEKRVVLENFLYPRLKDYLLKVAEADMNRFLIVEGVKLKEAGILELSDLKIAVIAKRRVQWQRLWLRGLPTYEIQSLLAAQKSIYDYLREANLIIENNGQLKELEIKARVVAEKIKNNESL